MNGSDLNKLIGGELINYDVDLDILGVAPPGKDTTSDAVFLFNSTYDISNLNARLLVVKELNKAFKYTQIIHPNPRLAMAKVMHHFYKNKNGIMPGISKYADIDPSATLSKSIQVDAFVSIGKNSVINQNTRIHSSVSIGENCQIGNNCVIFPNVTIYDNCKIGNNTIIHANSVIGADGFGYEKENDEWIKIPQISGVIIGDSVEIGSNTTIDSGCLIATEIDSGVKIDNMVHIAHNCKIKKQTVIAGGALIGGSTTIGENCIIAGDVSISNNIEITNGCIVMAKSGVTKSLLKQSVVSGYPAQNHTKEIRFQAFLKRLFRKRN